MDIKLQIEDIIENNGSDFELSKLFKSYIKEYKSSLDELFIQSQGKDFLVKHTKKLEFDEVVFAGGASKGELWSQTLADVLGVKVKIPKVKEATALGAAMAAGVGAGIYKDIASAAKELVVWERTYEPNMDNYKIYQDIKVKWQEVYEAQLDLVDRGLTESMWKAPGL